MKSDLATSNHIGLHIGMGVRIYNNNRERERDIQYTTYTLLRTYAISMSTMSSSWATDAALLAMAARVATRAASFGVGGTLAAADVHVERSVHL